MNRLFAVALCGAVGFVAVLPSAQAQQKTEKACQDEWKANKAANQAAKVTEKAYVEKCRGAAEAPAAAKTPAAAPASRRDVGMIQPWIPNRNNSLENRIWIHRRRGRR